MKLNYTRTFILGLGFLGVSAIWSIYNAFVPLYLSEKFHVAPAALAFFITLDNLAALLIQPPVGVWSDKVRSPLGRRMPFILFGAPVAALAFAFIPIAGVLPLFVLCTSTLLISMALWRTPAVALVADVTPSPLRSQASGVVNFMGGVGALLAYFGGGALAERNPAYAFWLGSVIVLVAAGLMLLLVREPHTHESQDVELEGAQPGFWASFLLVCREPNAFRTLLATFFLMVSYTTVEGFFSLYSFHHLGLSGAQSSVLLGQLSLVFVIFALPSGSIGAKIGRRITMMIGLTGMASLLLALYFIPVPVLSKIIFSIPLFGFAKISISLVALLLMLVGISYALIIVHPLPMLSDMTDNAHIGTYTGLYYLVTSLAAIVGPNVNGWVVQLSRNYNTVMIISPLFLVLALYFLAGVHKGEGR